MAVEIVVKCTYQVEFFRVNSAKVIFFGYLL